MKTRILFYLLISCCLLLTCCVKSIYEPDNQRPGLDPDPTPKPDPSEITFDDLKLKSVKINPDLDNHFYVSVEFKPDDKGVWSGKVEHYKADLTKLKLSFDAVAAKVTVNDKPQVSGETVNDFSKVVVYRLHTVDGQYKDFSISLENGEGTGVPLVVISTDGGKPIVSKEDWLSARLVIEPQDSEFARYDSHMEIKGRGNNSWRLAKKPYAIKLDEKSAVLGMNKHKRWVLLANASDRTLLRNRIAFEIGRRTGLPWTPDSHYVEVILNGKYIGCYLLCEQIRIDMNRIDIPEMAAEDISGEAITGGYLLEFDRYYDEVNKFRTAYRDLPVNIKEPDGDVLVDEQREYITNYVNQVERLLYGGNSIDKSYKDYIDINSFIDWWIVIELTHNRDTRLPGSCYMYKDRGGKLFAGPLWDFDLTTFISSTSFLLADYEVADLNKTDDRSLWYKKLFSDPEFQQQVKIRWQSYRTSLAEVVDFIDKEEIYLRSSAESNWGMWELNGNQNQDEGLSWEEAVKKLKDNYVNRLHWMDKKIQEIENWADR